MEIKEKVFEKVKPGLFLKKVDAGTYTEATRLEALKKISQSLRETPLEQRRQNQITPEPPNGKLLRNENRQELDYGNHLKGINYLHSAHIRTNVEAEEILWPQDLFPTVSTDTNPNEEIASASASYDYAFTPEDIDILCDIWCAICALMIFKLSLS